MCNAQIIHSYPDTLSIGLIGLVSSWLATRLIWHSSPLVSVSILVLVSIPASSWLRRQVWIESNAREHMSPLRKKTEVRWIKGPPGRLKIQDLKDSHVHAQIGIYIYMHNVQIKNSLYETFMCVNYCRKRDMGWVDFWILTHTLTYTTISMCIYVYYTYIQIDIDLYTLTANQMRARVGFVRHTSQFICRLRSQGGNRMDLSFILNIWSSTQIRERQGWALKKYIFVLAT